MNWFEKHRRNGWALSAMVGYFTMIGLFNFTSTLNGDVVVEIGFVLSLFGMWSFDKLNKHSNKTKG